MRLKRFKVNGFRSVLDSGWIDCDSVTSLIGVNESGKTNLLLPLWKLKPAKGGAVSLLADLPRSEYSQQRTDSLQRAFVTGEFETDEELAKELSSLTGVTAEKFDLVQCLRRFNGKATLTFPNAAPPRAIATKLLRDYLTSERGELDKEKDAAEKVLRASMLAALDQAIKVFKGVEEAGSEPIATALKSLSEVQISEANTTSTIATRWVALVGWLTEQSASINAPHPNQNDAACQLAYKHIPSFVYYSNYGNLDSEIYLPHVMENMKRQGLGVKEEAKARTLKVLFDFVNLQPTEILSLGRAAGSPGAAPTDDEVAAAAERTRERSILLQSAGAKLTKEFREWWKQGDYRFRFQADGDHFRIWVSDDKRPEEVELEARSTGLQWFLSFFLVFLVESADSHQGAVLLLDEPGLTLHPLAQRDLSAFFENLSKTNQLLFTTHSPFLVDPDRLDRVRSVFVDDNGATAISANLRAGKAGSRESKSVYAVHAALGLSVSDALLNGCTNVIVEGSSDQLYLTAMKTVLIAQKAIAPTAEILFLPGGGAKGAAAMVPIIAGKDESPPSVILDSDGPGVEVAKKLRSGPIYAGDAGKKIVNVGDLLKGVEKAEVEDLIPYKLIVEIVNRLYRSEDEDFADVAKDGEPIVPQIEVFAEKHGIELTDGWKVDLARAVKARILLKAKEIPKESLAIWTKLFAPFSA